MGKFDGILLASDFDGTFFCWGDSVPSQENMDAVKYFIDNGGLFTIATGRTADFIKNFRIPVNAPLITMGGTCIYDDKILKEFTFSVQQLNEAYFQPDSFYEVAVHCTDRDYRFPRLTQEELNQVKEPIYKIVFCFAEEDEAINFQNIIKKNYSSEFIFERSWPTGVEMLLKSGGKGTCLNIIKEMTNSRIIIAAGDFENDISMLKVADISYAPENALDSVKKIATYTGVHCKDHLIEYIINNI